MRTKKYRLWAAAALALTVTGFSACLKSDNPAPSRAKVNYVFLNASTFAPGIDIYNNGTKLTSTPFKIGQYSDYYTYRGTQDFTFKKGGADSTLGSIVATFDSLQIYTIVMLGEQPLTALASILPFVRSAHLKDHACIAPADSPDGTL